MSERRPEWASDLIAELFSRSGMEYAALNPGASIRGIHDSIVNYLGNTKPQLITCLHEQIAIAIAHGYAVSSSKPMLALIHDVVGLQQASVGIYNAWVDRAPMIVVGGTGPVDAAARRPWIDWIHTANVQADFIRDFIKWDDQPSSAAAIPRSFARALNIARSEPKGPVYLCYDAALQETPVTGLVAGDLDLTKFPLPTRLQAEEGALELLAERLVRARAPVLLTEYAGRYEGAVDALLELAQITGSPIQIVSPGRYVGPSTRPLVFASHDDELLRQADVLFAVDVMDLHGHLKALGGEEGRTPLPWTAHMRLGDLAIKGWSQDFQEQARLDQDIRCDPGLGLPRLVEVVRRRIGQRQLAGEVAARRDGLGEAWAVRRKRALAGAQANAGSPIRRRFVSWALRSVLEGADYVITKELLHGSLYELLDIDTPAKWVGMNAGGGLGNGLGFAIGGCLGRPGHDVYVALIGDGDFLYTPNALWTAAALGLPLLVVVANNGTYGSDEKHQVRIAEARGRSPANAYLGTRLDEPATDIVSLVKGLGAFGIGPVAAARDVVPALQKAVSHVRAGRGPVVVDVLTE